MKVKIIECDNFEDLENQVNVFLENKDIIVKDIKYQAMGVYKSSYYSCMIIYSEYNEV